MIGVSFAGMLNVDSMQADGHLLMYSDDRNKASFKDVILRGAKVTGQIAMRGASVDGKLDADALQVGGDLLMYSDAQNKASFKDVILRGAKVAGQIAMTGASFDGELDAYALQVGGDVLMDSEGQNKASFKDVDLRGAKVAGQIAMTGASFDGELTAEFLEVGGSLFMRDANCAQAVDMVFAHIGGNLDLRGTTLPNLNLSGTSVAGDLRLGGSHEPGALNLRNTHTGNLVDAKDAWPAKGKLHLDGFGFNHLGGYEGETGPEMRARGMDWWDQWARLDPDYSPAPYAQLAAALTNAGDRDAANENPFPRSGAGTRDRKRMGLRLVWCPSIRRGFRYRPLHFPGSLLGGRHLPRQCGAPLDERASSEATWANLVLRRQPLPALAGDRGQQGIHRVLQRSRTQTLDRLAKFYFFPDRHRGLCSRRYPARRCLRAGPKLLTQARDSTVIGFAGSAAGLPWTGLRFLNAANDRCWR